MEMLRSILVLGALCVAFLNTDGVAGGPRLLQRSGAFVSHLPNIKTGLKSTGGFSLSLPVGPTTARGQLKQSEEGSGLPRCYSYSLTYGGGPRGGGEGEGRTALITGATRGIGLAIAKTLAKGGVQNIICVARDQAACDAAAAEIRSLGSESEGYGVDVGDGAAVSALCSALLDKYKSIDILINNAGITRDNLFIRMNEKEWTDVINTNLNSAFYFSLPIIKRMVKRRFGRIINMASVVGIGGNVGQANYSASKAGLIGFSKSLAKEYANRNVTVNAIAPGFIESQMTDKMTDAAKAATLASVPAGRLGKAQEVADLAAFLASDQAAYINGKVIPIDGAMLFGSN